MSEMTVCACGRSSSRCLGSTGRCNGCGDDPEGHAAHRSSPPSEAVLDDLAGHHFREGGIRFVESGSQGRRRGRGPTRAYLGSPCHSSC